MDSTSINNALNAIKEINIALNKRVKDLVSKFFFIWVICMPIITVGLTSIIYSNSAMSNAENMLAMREPLDIIYSIYFLAPLLVAPIIIFLLSTLFYFKNIKISELINSLNESIKTIDNPKVIVNKMGSIYALIKEIVKNKAFIKIFLGINVYKKYNILLEDVLGYLTYIINDLKNDLNIGILENKENLEQAKIHLKKRIPNIPNLKEITQTQQIRLESQIAEFEKLQKILVKV